jgi:hypothetical protein
VPVISETRDYNGFALKASRLGLDLLVAEATGTLSFDLRCKEQRHANGTKGIRQTIDAGFAKVGGWTKISSGGIDWTKSSSQGATLGVEVQVSGRSDLLAVDIMHLKEKLVAGAIDAGLIIVPDDTLSDYLTDRTPNFATAVKHVEHRASDLPIRIVAFHHNGPGEALGKMRTNLGRYRPEPPPTRKVAEPTEPDSQTPPDDDPLSTLRSN